MFTCLADVLDSILQSENIWDESQQDPPSEDVPPSEVAPVEAGNKGLRTIANHMMVFGMPAR